MSKLQKEIDEVEKMLIFNIKHVDDPFLIVGYGSVDINDFKMLQEENEDSDEDDLIHTYLSSFGDAVGMDDNHSIKLRFGRMGSPTIKEFWQTDFQELKFGVTYIRKYYIETIDGS